MPSDYIQIASRLSQYMAKYRQDILETLEAAGKKEQFQEEVRKLIAQADAVRTDADFRALGEKIFKLVNETPELKELLLPDIEDEGSQMGVNPDIIKQGEDRDKQHEERLKHLPGIRQRLRTLVEDEKPSLSEKWLKGIKGIRKWFGT